MVAASTLHQLLHSTRCTSPVRFSSHSPSFNSCNKLLFRRDGDCNQFSKLNEISGHRILAMACNATSSSEEGNIVEADNDDDGVSLGTMILPLDIDIPRFETLLFQWANSLCQGANLPLPVPLKVDKIKGGARLGFITIGDGQTQVLVYIDCTVFSATEGSGPIFRAIRNGPLKDQSPPGEPRIMRSLLQALKKSVEIARV
ncbi:uncharacterized protein LOC122651957 [Telopea speciosissima]|uniref:uncharacterized protein LOC122651957 n=1 Tax=Telopea speciosissima TaxID=54955 RepID=UPI001CC66CE5|nr:uncharacterized protein LOC122651957 [Telopea speciosissima]